MQSVGKNDIVFECPACEKSMVIDRAGEGTTVDCPQCKSPVVVPPWSPPDDGGGLERMEADAVLEEAEQTPSVDAQVRKLTVALRETAARRKYLEKSRVEQLELLRVIREELLLMQQGLDRINSAVADRE